MLVLVAGATGNIGQKLIESLIRRGHRVRALGRSPQKLPSALRDQLESFVTISAHWDVAALDAAFAAGPVDAVINAYNGAPELQLEGQLLLLRAAERAGTRVFVTATWNYDWRKLRLGDHESYDPYLCFQRMVELSSTIKPVYILSGVLGEVLLATPGHEYYTAAMHGVWDPAAKAVEVWGDPALKWCWTSEGDAAEFAAAIAERPDAAEGGFWTVASGAHSLPEIAETYKRVRGVDVAVRQKGSVEELRKLAHEARRRGTPSHFWDYIGYFYTLHTVDDTWTLGELENEKLGVKGTSLEDFIRAHPEI